MLLLEPFNGVDFDRFDIMSNSSRSEFGDVCAPMGDGRAYFQLNEEKKTLKFHLSLYSLLVTPMVGAHGSTDTGFGSTILLAFEFNCHGSPNGCDLLNHGSTVAAGWGFDNHGSTDAIAFMLPFVGAGAAPFCSHASFVGVDVWLRDNQPSTLDTVEGFGVGSAHGSIGGDEAVFDHGSTFCYNQRDRPFEL